jgi:hypothetical protein
MTVRIRSDGGELTFKSLNEVRDALDVGMVSSNDHIQLGLQAPWIEVCAALAPRPGLWKPHYRWYGLLVSMGIAILLMAFHGIATVLLAPERVSILSGGVLDLLVVALSYRLWFLYVRRGGDGSPWVW